MRQKQAILICGDFKSGFEAFLASLPLVNLWNKRSLIFQFSLLSLKSRYRGTFLGFLWAALEPLFMFLLLYIVFTDIHASGKSNFGIYLITGIIFYHLFAKGTTAGLTCLRDNYGILQSLNVRKEIFPVVTTGSAFLLMFVELGVFFALMPFFNFIPSWSIVLLIPLLIIFNIFILGVSYLLSIVFVHARDIQPIWAVFVYALLFASPVFWYLDNSSGILITLQKINPLGQMINMAHDIVFGQLPTLYDWTYSTVMVLAILFFGYAVFQKYQRRVNEII